MSGDCHQCLDFFLQINARLTRRLRRVAVEAQVGIIGMGCIQIAQF
jgi:hypothetical protein